METGVTVIIWTILLITTTAELRGVSTASPPVLTPRPTATDPTSTALHLTPHSHVVETSSDSALTNEFPLHHQTSHTAGSAVPNSISPEPSSLSASTHTPVPAHTHSTKESTDTSSSLTSVDSNSTTSGSVLTLMASTVSPAGQTSTHLSTIRASEMIPTVSSVSSPASTHTVLIKTQATGAVPLQDPHQDGAPELDVGDEDADKVPHASPWDPLLAALVSIFIVSTALVSVMLFLRFRQQSEHPEFHRLQDLPMDDLLEDTPLSRYSY